MKKAIVLLSGGVDSAVTLYIAKKEYECRALIFDYGQKAHKEINCARDLARAAGCGHETIKIRLPWKGSSLIDMKEDIPGGSLSEGGKIPSTYVPARNIIFLSFGVSFAESAGAEAVFIGAHQLDFSNYPDCRTGFFEDFQRAVDSGTKKGAEGGSISIVAPVLNSTKKEIVESGRQLGVPFGHTWSCYAGDEEPCGKCESCLFRARAFEEAGIADPLVKPRAGRRI